MIENGTYIEKQPDNQSIEMLMRRYQQPLYRFCMHLCRSKAEADDLFQDVWLRVIKHIDAHDENYSWESWLFTIAINLYRDRYRKAKRWLLRVKPYSSNLRIWSVYRQNASHSLSIRWKRNVRRSKSDKP